LIGHWEQTWVARIWMAVGRGERVARSPTWVGVGRERRPHGSGSRVGRDAGPPGRVGRGGNRRINDFDEFRRAGRGGPASRVQYTCVSASDLTLWEGWMRWRGGCGSGAGGGAGLGLGGSAVDELLVEWSASK